jgi:hypothetical protein
MILPMGLAGRALNHVELVYRPGERELAGRVFSLLGCRVVDRGGTFFTAQVDPEGRDYVNNVVYASEVTTEQHDLEGVLAAALDGPGPLGEAGRAYLERLRHEPQRSTHFGIRIPTRERLDELVAGIGRAGDEDPDLKGRIGVSAVFEPGSPGSYTDTMVQAFVHTDVVAAGLLSLGQHFELQLQL